ncbi:D(1)-like dopamine receptor [Antedon mediterranea]|uniref:D(1)-like dopamine receptor n=1 Tax=Antedon mediterranea TaxID=105859 RepID=UPI003AF6C77C
MANFTDEAMWNFTANCTEFIPEPVDFTHPYNCILLLFGITGLIGNAIVIVIIVSTKALRSKMTYQLVCNLAISDLISSVLMIPRPDIVYDQSLTMEIVCRVYGTDVPFWTSLTASLMGLLMIAVDRYWAIATPFKCKSIVFSSKRYILLMFPWIYAVLVQMFGWFVRRVDDCGKCREFFNWQYALLLMGINIFLFTYLVPITCLLITYHRTIQAMTTMTRNMDKYQQGKASETLTKTKMKMTWVFFALTVVFIITWTPDQVLFLYYSTMYKLDYATKPEIYTNILTLVAFTNCLLNPFVYAFTQNTVRRKLGINCKKN